MGKEVVGFGKALDLDDLDKNDPTFQADPDNSLSFTFTTPDGKRALLSLERNSGCGSACDTFYAQISDKPDNGSEKPLLPKTPLAISWSVYKSDDGNRYLVGVVNDHLEVYRLASPKDFKLSCSVALAPQDLQKSDDQDVTETVKVLQALKVASDGMAHTGGYCGSGAWGYLHKEALERTLDISPYRPWELIAARDFLAAHGMQRYEEAAEGLRTWALGGISERRAFDEYEQRFATAATTLTKFYTKKFGWQPNEAETIANSVLKHAIGLGFSFGSSESFSPREMELRQALLVHKSMAEIKSIDIDISKIDVPDKDNAIDTDKDSILNVAIRYPEALRYLLEKKANPNHANAFGKTPLMYAAQYNQLEAAKVLLSFGANPNARTFIPTDQCEYTLKTSNMTALHYAARYASADMIRLLVKSGAAPYIKAARDQTEETPLDWLRYYATDDPASNGQAESKRNPNIHLSEYAALTSLLRLLDAAELAGIAAKQVTSAEARYAKGEIEPAYNATALALAADPNNQKALADFPLIALKTGRMGEAARAAVQATKNLKSPADQAAAWFNMGLICEQLAGRTSNDDGWLNCSGNHIYPFVRAVQLQTKPSREKKLIDVLQRDDAKKCSVEDRQYRFENNGGERIYVLHSADKHIDPQTIKLSRRNGDKTIDTRTPHISGTFLLNDKAMTLLEIDFSPTYAFIEERKYCELGYF